MTAADSPSLTIRPLRPEDEAAWRGLWAAYLAFYATELPEAVFASTFARLTSGALREPQGFIALSGSEPAGLAHYLFHRNCWETRDVCYLQDLFAVPEMRGIGLGRALMEAVFAAADAADASNVYWMTAETNIAARQLYDRIGVKTPFIEYHRSG